MPLLWWEGHIQDSLFILMRFRQQSGQWFVIIRLLTFRKWIFLRLTFIAVSCEYSLGLCNFSRNIILLIAAPPCRRGGLLIKKKEGQDEYVVVSFNNCIMVCASGICTAQTGDIHLTER